MIIFTRFVDTMNYLEKQIARDKHYSRAKVLHPQEILNLTRRGRWNQHTAAIAEGYLQANLIVLPRDLALDFLVFCQRKNQPCPVLEVTIPV